METESTSHWWMCSPSTDIFPTRVGVQWTLSVGALLSPRGVCAALNRCFIVIYLGRTKKVLYFYVAK